MLKIKKYNSKLKPNWNTFVENSNKNFFFFKRDYLEYKNNINDFSLLYFSDNELVAILPASYINHQIISHSGSTYGGIITKKKIKFEILNEIINSTLVYFKKKKFKKIIYKLIPSNFTYNLSAEEEYAISSLKNIKIYNNLNTYIDLNLKINFSKLVKRNINKSLKSDLSISKNNMKEFYSILKKNLKNKYNTIPTHTLKELNYLNKKFPNQIINFNVKLKNTFLGGYILYRYNDYIFHMQYSSFTELGKKMFAQDFLTNYLFNNLNMKIFSLGKSNDLNNNYLNLGLLRKKNLYGGIGISEKIFEIKI